MKRYALLLILLTMVTVGNAHGQLPPGYQFLTPMPGAKFVPPETGIIIRPGGLVQSSREEIADRIAVVGERSGSHTGSIVISSDGETIIFTPSVPFAPGEDVTVRIMQGIRTYPRAVTSANVAYHFSVSSDPNRRKISSIESEYTSGEVKDVLSTEKPILNSDAASSINVQNITGRSTSLNLPTDFPNVSVTVNDNPAEGFVFLAPFSWSSATIEPRTPYLLILDNTGEPVFFRRLRSACYDFKMQPNGHLTYFDNDPSAQVFIELDSTYTKVNAWEMGNGYGTDLHDFQMLPNGHALLMSYDLQKVDMSSHVSGGKTDADVVGFIIQEQDGGHNVVFEWRSWDHFKFTDAADNIDLTAAYIDYVHGNAVEYDRDGNLLISSRHMDEITKINRQTGEIIWRWGGENNQFAFINDTAQFTHQHDIRRLPNGNVMLFDNGNRHSPQRSRAVEYSLDEENNIATLVWEYPEGSQQYSVAMGNAQRLPNGNTMIGWGYPTQGTRKQALTEVHPDGSVAFDLLTDTNVVTYRAFRFPWSGTSAAPYLWTEDEDNTIADTLTVNLTMFGRDDIVEYTVVMSDADWPPPSDVVAVTTGNSAVVRGLERGKTYRLEAYGKTASGKETERSEQLLFRTLPTGPVITATPMRLSVGSAGIGIPSSTLFPALLSNIGEEPIEISAMSLEGNNAADFAITAGGDVPFTLVPGATHDVEIRFTPSREGTAVTTLLVRSNAINDTVLRLNLQGIGVSAAVSGIDVNVGKIELGSVKDTTVVGIFCNTGPVPLIVTSLEIDEMAFTLMDAPSLPIAIAPGECLNLTLRFTPTERRAYSGILRVHSTGKPNPLTISLTGGVKTIGNVSTDMSGVVRMLTVSPNPAVNDVRIAITLEERAVTTIEIVDSRGKLIRRYPLGSLESGSHFLHWDGRSASGRPCPNGTYFVHISADDHRLNVPVTLTK